MSSKLSVCLYTVIIDFTVMILLLLGSIMTIFYLQINVAKKFPDSCLINTSSTSTTFLNPKPTTKTTTKTITDFTEFTASTEMTTYKAITAITEIITTKETTATNVAEQSCNANSDCLGSSINGTSTSNVFQTTQCSSGVCECAPPYLEIELGPPYRCIFPNGVSNTCIDDIECSGRCQVNQNKCIAQ